MYILLTFYIFFLFGYIVIFEYSYDHKDSLKNFIIFMLILNINVWVSFFSMYRFITTEFTKFYYYVIYYWNLIFCLVNITSLFLNPFYSLNFLFQIIMNFFNLFYLIAEKNNTYDEIENLNRDYPEATYL